MTDATQALVDRKDAADRRQILADFERGRAEGHREALALVQVARDAMAAGGKRVTEIDALLATLRGVLEEQR